VQKYSVILFDIDDTLLDFPKSEREALCEALMLSGIELDDEMISTYQKINYELWKALERKEISRDELMTRRFKDFADFYGFNINADKTAKDYLDALGTKIYFIDGARELLSSLYGKVKMYIVTNGMACVQNSRYKLAGFDKVFNGMFISEEVGANKPDARFFEYVSEHIEDFKKERTLIIGDSQTSDIAGGNAFGIDTCWYSPNNAAAKYEPTYTVDSLKKVLPIALAEVDDE
jgi:2-haloacid dehalogenase